MAAKRKKTEKRPEVRIHITGPQGIGKTQLAKAIASFIGGTTNDGGFVEEHLALGSGTAVCRALEFIARQRPGVERLPETPWPKIIITTSNE